MIDKPLVNVSDRVSLQLPLSRRGVGPGLILLISGAAREFLQGFGSTLDPPPRQKWAEEGYAVAQIIVDVPLERGQVTADVALAAETLQALEECEGERFAVIGKPSHASHGPVVDG